MSTQAFAGGFTLKIGDGAGTEVFTAVSESIDVGEIGQTNSEIRVTHHGSTAHEFIAALGEGNSIDVTCNLALGDTIQDQIITDVNNKESARNFEAVFDDGTTERTLSFAAAMLSYAYVPTLGDQSNQNQLKFSIRMTGAVTSADV